MITAREGLRWLDQWDLETLIASVMASTVLLFVFFLHLFLAVAVLFFRKNLKRSKISLEEKGWLVEFQFHQQ